MTKVPPVTNEVFLDAQCFRSMVLSVLDGMSEEKQGQLWKDSEQPSDVIVLKIIRRPATDGTLQVCVFAHIETQTKFEDSEVTEPRSKPAKRRGSR